MGQLVARAPHGRTRPGLGTRSSRLWSDDGTDVGLLTSGVLALAATALAYALLLQPLKGTYVGILFYERGWVQYAITLLTCWSFAIVVLKLVNIHAQRRAFELDLLPFDLAAEIRPESTPALLAHLRLVASDVHNSFLVKRLRLACEHFGTRGDAAEVSAVLVSQRDIDAARVDGSYAMLRVLIWAIPILGFIGTVLGISDAVASFTGTVQAAGELDAIRASLGTVTGGLAVAFDTTLLALVMSVLIMFPVNALQKAEEGLLGTIDQYCIEQLLYRLRGATSHELASFDLPRATAGREPAAAEATKAAGVGG